MSASTQASSVVRLELTAHQAAQLASLIRQAAAESKNVLFFAVAAPFWRNDTTVWELQTTVIPARTAHKIRKLIGPREGGADA
jgi:hypothetical protein